MTNIYKCACKPIKLNAMKIKELKQLSSLRICVIFTNIAMQVDLSQDARSGNLVIAAVSRNLSWKSFETKQNGNTMNTGSNVAVGKD